MTTWLALLGGFSVLVIEILGVHLLSPWFGNSTIIWSQQIAIILLAMALGAWMGGNIAKSKQRLYSKLSLALGAAAVFFVLLAFGIDLLAVAILPTELGLEQVAGLFQIGSFASAIIFFAPPVFFLAWITPLLVEIRVEAGANAGQASGRLGAIATAGSLLGIYFSTFIAIPWLGVSASIIVVAILLAGSALVVSHRAKQLPLLAILFLFQYLPQPSTTAHLPSGANVVESLRTPYQKLRIIEFEDGERWLQMNEGLDSFQSKWLPGQQWPGGYYDLFALLPIYINYQSPRSSTTEYCILGYGAGSAVAPIAMGQGNDNWHLTGIELDPIVNELSNRHMPLSKDFNSKVAVWSSI
nr:fused MFS/spermidine synthase [Planctomycetota bacterium]